MAKVFISPSILSCNFSKLAEEISEIEKAGCERVHLDVMDGHFVPNLTFGPPVIQWIRKVTKLPLDVHLMIDEPIKSILDYRGAGADSITFHVEATQEVLKTLTLIKSLGAKAGMSVRPKTPISLLEPYLNQLDLILVMTVEPGFGGQTFMPEMLNKVRNLRKKGFSRWISVDGGINAETAPESVRAGADILVAGTAIFGQRDRKKAVDALRMI